MSRLLLVALAASSVCIGAASGGPDKKAAAEGIPVGHRAFGVRVDRRDVEKVPLPTRFDVIVEYEEGKMKATVTFPGVLVWEAACTLGPREERREEDPGKVHVTLALKVDQVGTLARIVDQATIKLRRLGKGKD